LNRDTLLSLYDRLAQLIEKLPGGLQKPILRELAPIREVFLDQRPARLMLIGSPGKSVPEFLHSISGVTVETGASDNGWRSYHLSGHAGRGEILILDARFDAPQEAVDPALARFGPDAVIYLKEGIDVASSMETASARAAASGSETPVVGVAYGGESARARLAALLSSDRQISMRKFTVCSPELDDQITEAICASLPNAARLEFARLIGAKKAQAEIATSLLKSFTTMCGVIGLQPIPLADMPVLTALQSLMVSLIVYVSGKKVNARLITEFLGALGLGIGAGILFRESARAIIRIVPVWGNAVSGVVAGAGTYAVGRAAIAYFIEETPIAETRKLFHQLLPSWDAFKRRRLPGLKKRLPPNE
jgi:uncharacterized protein (DUF697 family)